MQLEFLEIQNKCIISNMYKFIHDFISWHEFLTALNEHILFNVASWCGELSKKITFTRRIIVILVKKSVHGIKYCILTSVYVVS